MKQLLILLASVMMVSAGPVRPLTPEQMDSLYRARLAPWDITTTVSLVQIWPDYTVTLHCVAGSIGGQNGMYVRTSYPNGSFCDSYFDCPLQPYQWGNVLVGQIQHGCASSCGGTFSYTARQDTVQQWGNTINVSILCNNQ